MSPAPPPEESKPQLSIREAAFVASFPRHRIIFLGLNAVAIALGWALGSTDVVVWAFLGTGALLLLHTLVIRALAMDDSTATEQARARLRRSYERANINGVLKDHRLRRDARDADTDQ